MPPDLCACVWRIESDRERLPVATDDPSPPTADVARCDLLAQLSVLLAAADSSSSSAAVTVLPPPRSTSSPGMLRPDDSVPCVDTSPTGTVPNDDSVDSEATTSGMLYIPTRSLIIHAWQMPKRHHCIFSVTIPCKLPCLSTFSRLKKFTVSWTTLYQSESHAFARMSNISCKFYQILSHAGIV